jgi:D-alanyl-D-alanine carboxypeptidase (penicillin-binding protein 5/6)
MRRMAARLVIAGTAVAVAGLAAGCSAATATDYAQGATQPGPSSTSALATVPASAHAKVAPDAGQLALTGAPQGVKAKAGILVDAATNQVVWERSEDEVLPIASITKVMTALVIIQAGGLNRQVAVPKSVTAYTVKYGAEAAGLKPGQVFTVNQLLHAMVIESAADAAYTLASAYGPGLPAFIAKMNAVAAKLGLANTHFTSPDGLPYPTETSTYSTPVDLVRLAQVAMGYPLFRSIVAMPSYNLAKDGSHSAYSFVTDSAFLKTYAGATGIKTGYTDGAGHCLLFEAIRGGRTFIGVVLGSPVNGGFAAAAQDAAKVLNWGWTLKPAS